jgi:hypothetical protein
MIGYIEDDECAIEGCWNEPMHVPDEVRILLPRTALPPEYFSARLWLCREHADLLSFAYRGANAL